MPENALKKLEPSKHVELGTLKPYSSTIADLPVYVVSRSYLMRLMTHGFGKHIVHVHT